MPKEIPIIFPIVFKGSNYDYHFIIKEREEEIERLLSCLGENTEKNT